MQTVRIRVEGMSCSHCEASVREALESLPGVERVVEVSAEADEATVQGCPDPAMVAERLEELGFSGMVTDD